MSKRRWLRYFAASPTTDPGQRSAVRSETASSGQERYQQAAYWYALL